MTLLTTSSIELNTFPEQNSHSRRFRIQNSSFYTHIYRKCIFSSSLSLSLSLSL
uniref:Uncharacterized protein n=1 Tax=Manihot esculenta TaxID=3983 RepID=A0A2C9UQ66_MANES